MIPSGPAGCYAARPFCVVGMGGVVVTGRAVVIFTSWRVPVAQVTFDRIR